MTHRIHQAWWSPRVFPFVPVLVVLVAYGSFLSTRRYYQTVLFLGFVLALVVGLLLVQLRRCRILLLDDSIVFPEWRKDDASEVGLTFDPRLHFRDFEPERITVLQAPEIADWILDRRRIVITTREGRRHGIGVRGLRPRDRERIVAWLVENVGG